MIPEFHEAEKDAKDAFSARAEGEFEDHYYAEGENEAMWCVRDMAAKDAPHRPVYLNYKQSLAHFRTIENVLTDLVGEQYVNLAKRIQSRFVEDAP